jgi:hypothetical protein
MNIQIENVLQSLGFRGTLLIQAFCSIRDGGGLSQFISLYHFSLNLHVFALEFLSVNLHIFAFASRGDCTVSLNSNDTSGH